MKRDRDDFAHRVNVAAHALLWIYFSLFFCCSVGFTLAYNYPERFDIQISRKGTPQADGDAVAWMWGLTAWFLLCARASDDYFKDN
jgi:hypothetical protein